ncbi:MAG: acyl-CoA/acyl-ACP dehydrogenase [Pseudomonadales bacterium]|nr:acyl-CoA/acyl-ACP dehydrogenase [Gammaproteobacteria bacterium]MBP6051834.1 acyl-CoA/acyl-ACP dehydrogenase [Pseudomonadales bacterium]MBK6582942.1 acyl-CoA/acyl-ACP dehydrogenase [Gammaproteobacteria bacterium]MBK7168170.1 acyl-CoA/acyl-ACP dehydrogenase [Gammaproteobacteria bacterium]MBK9665960.1 acyl-CoA/acyl-ACP dehydrogenase [Gammaproteobacteria bacterium]
MLKLGSKLSLPSVSLTGFETPLAEEERAIQSAAHQFARDVLRPLGRELDKLTAEQVVAPGSPYYTLFAEAAKLGMDPGLLEQLPPEMAIRVESMIGEEMGWGDAGLAVSLVVTQFPLEMARAAGNQELIELSTGKIGCWMITHPDKGTDVGAFDMKREWAPRQQGNKGSLLAKVGKDEIVINGQCSAWVSNGAVAQVALTYMSADYGDGYFDADGRPNGVCAIVPLDLPGVSKGKPLEKIGQRALPQGEVYFDNVRIPKRFAVALREEYYGNVASAWSFAGTHMSQIFTGVARAAFEMALQYCHERKQGGQLLIDQQLTRYRLGDMMRRVELCRSVARRSLAYARLTPAGHPWATASAKVTVTEEAEKIVADAFRLFGGNGTTREYPIEKLVRDVRAALIEDGENTMLTTRLGFLCQQLYEDGWARN